MTGRAQAAREIAAARRRDAVLSKLLELGATGTPTVTTAQVTRRLGFDVTCRRTLGGVSARLRAARDDGEVCSRVDWDATSPGQSGGRGLTRWALTDRGIRRAEAARRERREVGAW